MRDLLFKNITSADRMRRRMASREEYRRAGLHTTVARHFVCIIRDIGASDAHEQKPHVYVFRYQNTRKKQERYICRIRGSVRLAHHQQEYIVDFCNSVRIQVEQIRARSKALK